MNWGRVHQEHHASTQRHLPVSTNRRYQITLKYAALCTGCHRTLDAGRRAVWFPDTKHVVCLPCSLRADPTGDVKQATPTKTFVHRRTARAATAFGPGYDKTPDQLYGRKRS